MRFRPIVRVRVLQPDIAAGPTEAASELKWRTQKNAATSNRLRN
jgi:hypothetical protein